MTTSEKKITVMGVIKEGLSIGLKNLFPLLGATILWLITFWIPYINVGTTIAMASIPLELSKGKVISPLFIFDAKYRQYMGEFFTLMGLMIMSLIPAFSFGFVPGIIISLGWSLALLLMLDKGMSPSKSLIESNKATYGYKWTIFGVSVIILLLAAIIVSLLGIPLGVCIPLGDYSFIILILVLILVPILVVTIALGCSAVIYKNLIGSNNNVNDIDVTPQNIIEE